MFSLVVTVSVTFFHMDVRGPLLPKRKDIAILVDLEYLGGCCYPLEYD